MLARHERDHDDAPPSPRSTWGRWRRPSRVSTHSRSDPATRPVPPYDRDAFGTAWADVDGNGCNQRDDVLLRDAVPDTVTVAQQGACDHDVLAGTWVDPYTGRTLAFDDLKDLRQAQAIQIDHVVPLAEAWRSGAAAWGAARRKSFANDLAVLLASDGPTNAAKGDDDPAAWRPRRSYQCEYAVALGRREVRAGHSASTAASRVRCGRCSPPAEPTEHQRARFTIEKWRPSHAILEEACTHAAQSSRKHPASTRSSTSRSTTPARARSRSRWWPPGSATPTTTSRPETSRSASTPSAAATRAPGW